MKAELINPFIESTTNVLTTMCRITPIVGQPCLKKDGKTWGVATGIIGMVSDSLTGNMLLSFDEPSVIEIVNNMLTETFTTLNADIIDAVGELTNMISGGAKQRFSELGYAFKMATPVMITGQGVGINQLSKAPIIQIPFTTQKGKFVIEANLMEMKS